MTVVTDNATWDELCEASQHRPDLGADWVRQSGEVIIGGNWLTEPGVIRLWRRENGMFKA
ncbi:TPA: hypothetical protein U5D21_002144 [Yersinia enterocolitica]|nr:hypothetical protein [Yersinia enterocolitica]